LQTVNEKVSEKYAEAQLNSEKWQEFQSLVSQGKDLVATLQEKLDDDGGEAVDAEEMAAQMDVS